MDYFPVSGRRTGSNHRRGRLLLASSDHADRVLGAVERSRVGSCGLRGSLQRLLLVVVLGCLGVAVFGTPAGASPSAASTLMGADAAVSAAAAPTVGAGVNQVSFSYTGAVQTFVVPPAVYALTLHGMGGTGGWGGFGWYGLDGSHYVRLSVGAFGGHGAVVDATVYVNPGDRLDVWLGGRGGDGGYPSPSRAPGAPGDSSGWPLGTAAGGAGGSGDGDAGPGGGGGGATGLVDVTAGEVLLAAGGGGGGGGGGGVSPLTQNDLGGIGGDSAYLANSGQPGQGFGAGGGGTGLSGDPAAAAGGGGLNLTLGGGAGGGGGGAPQVGPGGSGGGVGSGGGGGGAGGASEVGLGLQASFSSSSRSSSLDGSLSIAWTTPQSSVTVASTANPATGGTPITLTATVGGPRSSDRTPTGTVSFTANGQALGAADVDFSGRATLTGVALPAGTSSIQASYSGDGVYAPSVSGPLDEEVVQPLQSLSLSASTLEFAPQIVGQGSPAQTLTVTNTGAQPVGFASVQAAGAGYETSANTCQSQLAPGSSCTVQVTLAPTGPGPVSGVLTLTDDAGAQSVTLTGSGITASTPVVTAVNPPAGYTTGGTVVTISGSNLDGASSVTFGGIPANAVSCTPTACTATSPATTTTGVIHVQVTTPAGTSPSTLADRFAYIPHG